MNLIHQRGRKQLVPLSLPISAAVTAKTVGKTTAVAKKKGQTKGQITQNRLVRRCRRNY
jgi:hypothetical protein